MVLFWSNSKHSNGVNDYAAKRRTTNPLIAQPLSRNVLKHDGILGVKALYGFPKISRNI